MVTVIDRSMLAGLLVFYGLIRKQHLYQASIVGSLSACSRITL